MNRKNETPEERRERLRHEELKQPSSSINGSNLADIVGSLGWKGSVVILLLLILGLIVVLFFL